MVALHPAPPHAPPIKKNKEVVTTSWEATRREYGGLVHNERLGTTRAIKCC